MIKSTALLTVALFFTVAPSPDAETWSEMTGGLLKAGNSSELSATEFNPIQQNSYADVQPTFDITTSL